jgi:hypothetical protein
MTLQVTYHSAWKIGAAWLVLGGAEASGLGVALS